MTVFFSVKRFSNWLFQTGKKSLRRGADVNQTLPLILDESPMTWWILRYLVPLMALLEKKVLPANDYSVFGVALMS